VVFEFGFRPENLEVVVALIDQGWHAWWFEGDRDATHSSYTARQQRLGHDAVGSELAYQAQMRRIAAARDAIAEVFGTRRIRVVEPGPSHMDPADVHAIICKRDGV
jgi:hypothetical protein